MNMFRIPGLALACLFAVAVSPARADEAADRSVVAGELFAAQKLSAECWDLPRTCDAFEKVRHDLLLLQAKYPDSKNGSMSVLVPVIQRDIDILTWEERASAPDDPHGMKDVIERLQLYYQAAQADESAKRWNAAEEEYEKCALYWTAVKQLHPGWEPDFVEKQIEACTMWHGGAAINLWKYQYTDVRFGTALRGD